MYNRGEISEFDKREIYKSYEMLPSFRRIADTTNTTWYGLDIYLLPSINSLTHNYYSAKNTFEAVNKIYSIPPELLEQEYHYYSLDVASVFTIVYLNWIIKIIYKRVYRKKLLTTKLGNTTMNKLVEDIGTSASQQADGFIIKHYFGISNIAACR